MGICMSVMCGPLPKVYSDLILGDEEICTTNREWKPIPSQALAQETFEGEGTINGQSSQDQLEFRRLLDYDIAKEYLLTYMQNRDLFDLELSFRCWMQIRKHNDHFFSTPSDRLEASVSLYKEYIRKNPHIDTNLKRRIESGLERGLEHPASLVRIFDLVYVKLFLLVYKEVYVAFSQCPEHKELMLQIKNSVNTCRPKDFDFHGVIGKGGFGLVCEVCKKSTGTRYAMKIQGKQGVFEMFGDEPWRACLEMRAFASCKHPFIVELQCAFQTESLLFLVMTLGTWCDLSKVMRTGGPLSYDHALFYTAEVTSALIYLHSKHFVYRDLKPANVLLNMDGHVQLIDFGAVCDLDGRILERCHSRKHALFADETINEPSGIPFDSGFGGIPSATDKQAMPTAAMTADGYALSPTERFAADFGSIKDVVSCGSTIAGVETGAGNSLNSGPQDENPNASLPKRAKSLVGTYGYMAPEMAVLLGEKNRVNSGYDAEKLNRGYTKAVDWWSLGVLVYKMFVGAYPFRCGQDNKAVPTWEILSESVNYSYPALTQHPDAIDFISALLTVDENKRLGSEPAGAIAVRKHAFFDSIDWNQLEAKLSVPPKLPKVNVNNLPRRNKKYDNLNQLLCMSDKEEWLHFGKDEIDVQLQYHFASWDYSAPRLIAAEIELTKSKTRTNPTSLPSSMSLLNTGNHSIHSIFGSSYPGNQND